MKIQRDAEEESEIIELARCPGLARRDHFWDTEVSSVCVHKSKHYICGRLR